MGSYNLESLPLSLTRLISTGLTTVEPDGTVSPSLAQRWIVENNGKTYRFVLKKNIIWQDGQKFSPKDINYNFRDGFPVRDVIAGS